MRLVTIQLADRRLGAVLVGVVFISICLSASASRGRTAALYRPSSTISTHGFRGKILFTRAGGKYGDETVFTATADGRRVRRITGFGKTCCPRWAPDGQHIVIAASASDGRITTGIVLVDGSHERTIPLPAGKLNLGCTQAWSAKTGRLACEGWDDGDPSRNGVYTVDASDGESLTRVTHGTGGGHDIPMGFAPDGHQIFFLREATQSLYAVNVDGSNLHPVLPHSMRVDVVGNAGGRLSRDGSRIVFTSSRTIWVIHPDGSGLKKVFRDRKRRIPITPTWSPDGRLILFGLDPVGSSADVEHAPPNSLYVMTAQGTKLTPLLASTDWKREPDWTR
jgi:Tol biopolymer transport system component